MQTPRSLNTSSKRERPRLHRSHVIATTALATVSLAAAAAILLLAVLLYEIGGINPFSVLFGLMGVGLVTFTIYMVREVRKDGYL